MYSETDFYAGRLRGPQLVWTQRLEEKSSAYAEDQTPVVQSVVTLYCLSYPRLRIGRLTNGGLL
jgi:hypothetical protein